MKFRRHITEKIDDSLTTQPNKPILILGARQVGKTSTILNYLKLNNIKYLHINLESDKTLLQAFEGDLNPSTILQYLKIATGVNDFEVLFIDEIQVSSNAITSLKYFNEQYDGVKVICSGSALSNTLLSPKTSYPVGKVTSLNMYPLTFDEFLINTGQTDLAMFIQDATDKMYIADIIHNKALEEFDKFITIGAMPESLDIYLKFKDISKCIENNKQILESYKRDVTKYASTVMRGRILSLYEHVDIMLNNDNKKFRITKVDGLTFKRIEEPISWLKSSQMVIQIFNIDKKQLRQPLRSMIVENNFKLYMGDTSLLIAQLEYNYFMNLKGKDQDFKGFIFENYIAQVLNQKFKNLFYHQKDHSEIHFIVSYQQQIVPIEVKAGLNTRATSLDNFVINNNCTLAIKFSREKYIDRGIVKCYPLYAADYVLNES